jgi:hypothetical protein
MRYYNLSAAERKKLNEQMEEDILQDLSSDKTGNIQKHASDADTYIRKSCYLILGRLYKTDERISEKILSAIDLLSQSDNEKIRQTAVYALGEIGKLDFSAVDTRLEAFLQETHHSVKNGLTGAIKQIGEKNPEPVFVWVKEKIKNCNVDMRKRILHGLELRGRTHPEELLPVIKDIAQEKLDKETEKMLIHIIGQISYKKGCIEKVVAELKTWKDKAFIAACGKEIIEVHKSYERFSALSHQEAEEYLAENFSEST